MTNPEPTDAQKQKACDLLNAEADFPNLFNLPQDAHHYALRTVARLIAKQEATAPAIPSEIVEDMERLIRDLRADHLRYDMHDRAQDFCSRTEAVVAALDALKPVDPLDAVFDALPDNIGTCVDASAEFRKECAKRGLHITEIQR